MLKNTSSRAPKDVYLSFVSSLFGNRNTLVIGVVVHILTYLAVFHKTQDFYFIILSIAFAIVFLYRVMGFLQFSRLNKTNWAMTDIRRWEIRYVVGAAATASILGVGCGYSILVYDDTFVELACIAVTMASMVSVVGRNYGSRLAVNLQSLACCLPIIVGSLFSEDPYKFVLSVMLVPFVLTTQAMATGVREFLYENVIASRQMRKIADSFDTALNNMTHGLIMLDTANRIQVINNRACNLLHLGDRRRLQNCDLDVVMRYGVRHTFVDGAMPGIVQKQLKQLIDGTLSRAVMTFSDDLILEFSANRRPEGGVVLIFEDVSARINAERKILHMVRFDSLTGLPQRNYFRELVDERMAQARPATDVGFLIVDVDEFKHVNDMKGHVTGDKLLVEIANRLGAAIDGDHEVAGRLVGDQFMVFASSTDGMAALDARMRGLHQAVTGDYSVDGTTFNVSFSAGCILATLDELRTDEWLIKVDLALFESKSRGNGAFTLFAEEMDARYVERQRLKSDLRRAIEQQELHVVYQPMYRPDGSAMECCEALSRWIHPTKGPIPPNIFIQVAEEMGIASDITRFMIQQACRDCVKWPEQVAVSVNLSVLDLRNDSVVSVVKDALSDTGIDPQRLHLEVTENTLIEELATVRHILEQLRAIGITISIDDFGTGFSSLSYLDKLPADILKIDRSFVLDISNDARRFKLLRGIVNLARQLDLKIVVEGVEDNEQLALINKYKCADLIQGYIYSMPVPADQIADRLVAPQRKSGNSRMSVA